MALIICTPKLEHSGHSVSVRKTRRQKIFLVKPKRYEGSRCKLTIKNGFKICKQNRDTPVTVYLCVNAASNIFLVKPKRYESQFSSRLTAASLQISVSAAI